MDIPIYLTDALLPSERAQVAATGRDPDAYVAATGFVAGGIPYMVDGVLGLDLRVHAGVSYDGTPDPAEICLGVGELRLIVPVEGLSVATPAAAKGQKVHVVQLRWPDNALMTRALAQLGFSRDVTAAPPACVEVIAWTRAEALAWVAAMAALGATVLKPPQMTLWAPGAASAPVAGLAELPEHRTPGVYLAPLPAAVAAAAAVA